MTARRLCDSRRAQIGRRLDDSSRPQKESQAVRQRSEKPVAMGSSHGHRRSTITRARRRAVAAVRRRGGESVARGEDTLAAWRAVVIRGRRAEPRRWLRGRLGCRRLDHHGFRRLSRVHGRGLPRGEARCFHLPDAPREGVHLGQELREHRHQSGPVEVVGGGRRRPRCVQGARERHRCGREHGGPTTAAVVVDRPTSRPVHVASVGRPGRARAAGAVAVGELLREAPDPRNGILIAETGEVVAARERRPRRRRGTRAHRLGVVAVLDVPGPEDAVVRAAASNRTEDTQRAVL
mmetsp:Transcript_10438/g.42220  ORF Transcript_10438/g.42220 Transcript_10438/m.42220 type:complete len:293 (-) Transcript_10438:340-1218(-)